jgi:hypothetical protein
MPVLRVEQVSDADAPTQRPFGPVRSTAEPERFSNKSVIQPRLGQPRARGNPDTAADAAGFQGYSDLLISGMPATSTVTLIKLEQWFVIFRMPASQCYIY